MSSSSRCLDANALNSLQESLKQTKNISSRTPAFFPSQAVTRGGIGNLVATGTARGHSARLPQAERARKASARLGLSASNSPRGPEHSSYSYESLTASTIFGGGAGLPDAAKHEWEKGTSHPFPFCPAARRVGIKDLKNPRWATMSYFENREREVAKHIAMIERDEREHENFISGKDADEQVRHQTWAAQQREIFYRQREDKADLYARSGAPVRQTYLVSKSFATSRPMTAPATRSASSLAPPGPNVPLPKPSQPRVYKNMEVEKLEMVATAAERLVIRAKEVQRSKEEDEIRESLGAIEKFEVMTLREVLRRQATERRGGRSWGTSKAGDESLY